MRTGKTRAVIERAQELWRRGLIEGVVVLAPNGVHSNWELRELPKYHSEPYSALSWCHPERDEAWFKDRVSGMLLPEPLDRLDWLTVNSESLQFPECKYQIGKFVGRRRFLLVADESDDYGAPGSKRTKFARSLARKAAFRMILTGTVVEDSPLKAFSQYEILDRAALGFETAEAFNARYAEYEKRKNRKGRSYEKVKRYVNMDELRASMARWSSVVLRSDCHDMPEMLRVERAYRPSPEQLSAYEEIRRELSLRVDDNLTVTAAEAAVRLIKLQQVLSGYIIDKDGRVHDIPGRNPRLDVVSSEVMFDPGKVIVACRFREDVARVARRLREDGHSVATYVGGMAQGQKNEALDEFQAGRHKAIVITPIRGLELSAADTVFWYSHVFWAMMRSQTDERATKMGGTATTVVDCVAEGIHEGVDRYILDNQTGKRDVSEDLARGGMKRVLEECKI